MPRSPRDQLPTSVILTQDQKTFIKKVAEKESRSFSHQVRFIIAAWIAHHSKKKEFSKPAETAGE